MKYSNAMNRTSRVGTCQDLKLGARGVSNLIPLQSRIAAILIMRVEGLFAGRFLRHDEERQ